MLAGRLVKCAVIQIVCLQLQNCVESASNQRKEDHVTRILLKPDRDGFSNDHPVIKKAFERLKKIYSDQIRPVEKLTKFGHLYQSAINEADVDANPVVLVAGPWSSGKSTLINHLLGIKHQSSKLYIGAEPTTADFVVLTYGKKSRSVDGSVLTASKNKFFKDLRALGSPEALKRVVKLQLHSPLLRNLTFVDTPGILENRRLQDRGYPFNRLMSWFVDKAQLILIVFDPTKLDVGHEMEALLQQLKGKEPLVRIVLNKADSVTETQLMRVYGALFWSLSPLFNVTEAPRVYVSSFRSEKYMGDDLEYLFQQEEQNLLDDIYSTIVDRVPLKVAKFRSHAQNVRAHALLIDAYVKTYGRKRRWLSAGTNAELARDIAARPGDYRIFEQIPANALTTLKNLAAPLSSPLGSIYENFFQSNPLENQQPIGAYKSNFFGSKGDLLSKINKAIDVDLPEIIKTYEKATAVANGKMKVDEPTTSVFPGPDKKRDKKKTAFMEHYETFKPKYSTNGFEDLLAEGIRKNDEPKQEAKEAAKVKTNLPQPKHVEKPKKFEEIHIKTTKSDKVEKTAKLLATNCPIYRKTCERPAEKFAKPPKDAPAEKRPCVLYRKSCREGVPSVLKVEQKELSVDKSSTQSPVEKLHIKASQPVVVKKCPIYRKKCDHTLTVEKSTFDAQLKNEEEPTKCIIYRKSCKSGKNVVPQAIHIVKKDDSEKPKKAVIKDDAKKVEEQPIKPVEKVKTVPTATVSIEPDFVTVDTKSSLDKKLDKSKTFKDEKRSRHKKYDNHNDNQAEISKVPVKINSLKEEQEKAEYGTEESVELGNGGKEGIAADAPSAAKLDLTPILNEKIATQEIKLKVKKSATFLENCPKYRKSCKSIDKKLDQPATEKSKKATVTVHKITPEKLAPKTGKLIEKLKKHAPVKKSNFEAEKHKKLKKQAGRVLDDTDQKQPKITCSIYRKSCVPSAKKETKHDEFSFDFSDFFEKFTFISKSLFYTIQREKKGAASCPIYRKSCGSSPKKPNIFKPLESSMGKDEKVKKSTEKAPVEKREKVAPKDRTEEATLEKTKPTEPEKCLIYRKSCTVAKVPSSSWTLSLTKFEQLWQQGQKLDAKTTEKCPPYRKSCVSAIKVVHKTSERPKVNKSASSEQIGSPPKKEKTKKSDSMPCPVYRKSCDRTIKATSKEKQKFEGDYIYVVDQETGKVKKYCKKKRAASDSSENLKTKKMPLIERLVRYLCS